VLKRADFLGQLMEGHQGIAVAGTHGKTTTTAMIAWMLTALDQDPSFIVGGVISNLKTNARAGKGETFIIEADEYDRMFLGLRPQIAVITNIEHDHPDIYPSPEAFEKAFQEFVDCVSPDGLLISCGDDSGARELASKIADQDRQILTYSIQNPQADYQAKNLTARPGSGFTFDIYQKETKLAQIHLQVPGEHNVLNALSAFAIAHKLELPPPAAAQALSEFSGTGRRFEIIGEASGVTVIDDYAHHPTEIQATLDAATARYPDRVIWAVWQPHTYSRSQMLFDAFAASFAKADHVIITEVYRSREPIDPDFSARQFIAAMRHKDAHFVQRLPDVTSFLNARLQSGDILIVLSAGDANQVSTQVYASLKQKSEVSRSPV
jgi:UDP-N-acetylmuramate--alanine ligase